MTAASAWPPTPTPTPRLWRQLPPQWRGPVIGPGIEDWEALTENGDRRIDLTGLPDPFPAELAWMAHWQAADGTRCSVLARGQRPVGGLLAHLRTSNPPVPHPSFQQTRCCIWPCPGRPGRGLAAIVPPLVLASTDVLD